MVRMKIPSIMVYSYESLTFQDKYFFFHVFPYSLIKQILVREFFFPEVKEEGREQNKCKVIWAQAQKRFSTIQFLPMTWLDIITFVVRPTL